MLSSATAALSENSQDVNRYRQLLGDEATVLSDDEIERIRCHADAMARVIVDAFIRQMSRTQAA